MTTRKEIVERLARLLAANGGWTELWKRVPDGVKDMWREDAERLLSGATKAGLTITLKPKRRASGK